MSLLLLGAAQAIYPDGHWSYAKEMTVDNFSRARSRQDRGGAYTVRTLDRFARLRLMTQTGTRVERRCQSLRRQSEGELWRCQFEGAAHSRVRRRQRRMAHDPLLQCRDGARGRSLREKD